VAADAASRFGTKIPGQTLFTDAQLNETASSEDSTYNIYSATLELGNELSLSSAFNVGATIGGKNVTDWTTFSGVTFTAFPRC
jgi:hypothetical protein